MRPGALSQWKGSTQPFESARDESLLQKEVCPLGPLHLICESLNLYPQVTVGEGLCWGEGVTSEKDELRQVHKAQLRGSGPSTPSPPRPVTYSNVGPEKQDSVSKRP